MFSARPRPPLPNTSSLITPARRFQSGRGNGKNSAKPSSNRGNSMKKIVIANLLVTVLTCGPALAWSHAGGYSAGASHNDFGGSSAHADGYGSTHTNASAATRRMWTGRAPPTPVRTEQVRRTTRALTAVILPIRISTETQPPARPAMAVLPPRPADQHPLTIRLRAIHDLCRRLPSACRVLSIRLLCLPSADRGQCLRIFLLQLRRLVGWRSRCHGRCGGDRRPERQLPPLMPAPPPRMLIPPASLQARQAPHMQWGRSSPWCRRAAPALWSAASNTTYAAIRGSARPTARTASTTAWCLFPDAVFHFGQESRLKRSKYDCKAYARRVAIFSARSPVCAAAAGRG